MVEFTYNIYPHNNAFSAQGKDGRWIVDGTSKVRSHVVIRYAGKNEKGIHYGDAIEANGHGEAKIIIEAIESMDSKLPEYTEILKENGFNFYLEIEKDKKFLYEKKFGSGHIHIIIDEDYVSVLYATSNGTWYYMASFINEYLSQSDERIKLIYPEHIENFTSMAVLACVEFAKARMATGTKKIRFPLPA